jgi:sugar (pentulose or hexulose) kinase
MPPPTIFGVTPAHSLGDVARATLESVCYAVRGNLEQLEAVHGSPFPRVTLAGGAGQSPLWSQILADVLGKTVRVPLVPEASAVAGGRLVLKDQREAWGGLLPARHHEPDPTRHAAYQPHYERYLAVHEGLSAAFGGTEQAIGDRR